MSEEIDINENWLDITPSARVLQILGEIPFEPWQCLAELIDNSFDELSKQTERTSENPLLVTIDVDATDQRNVQLVIRDNGTGMDRAELERSLKAGHSGKNRYGTLGLFGMGFNIATARLGTITTVETKKLGANKAIRTVIDFAELQRKGNFSVPFDEFDAPMDESGTTVRIKLKNSAQNTFTKLESRRAIALRLGEVYSFLLRESVPGISKAELSAKIPAKLIFAGEEVLPKLPCIWSDERTVLSRGEHVTAVQYIDVQLTEATACLDCGFWDNNNGPEYCQECESPNLELRSRRIWGWLGIQRYLDTSKFGVDFLRYGRKILLRDRTLFTYVNRETLEETIEYPVEMPANKGRIVGEIHLDHVPVVYQKNDFDRQLNSWQTAIEKLRGTGPLFDRVNSNNSPIAVLFSAFRRNDPGLRYLTPGDGKKAQLEKAKDWGESFDKGVERFRLDTEWFEAAKRHDNLKSGVELAEGEQPKPENGKTKTSIQETMFGSTGTNTNAESPEAQPAPVAITREQVIDQAKMLGSRREDLSASFSLGNGVGDWTIEVWSTREQLKGESGNTQVAIPGTIEGRRIEVLVNGLHPVIKDFGRDFRDIALLQAASIIHSLLSTAHASASPVSAIYSDLVQSIPDLKTTAPQILERIEGLLRQIRGAMFDVVKDDTDAYWAELNAGHKTGVEKAGANVRPDTAFSDLVDSGEFIDFVNADGIAAIIESSPNPFFGGTVFKPLLLSRDDELRSLIVSRFTSALRTIGKFASSDSARQPEDIKIVQVYIDYLQEQLVLD
jgi:hypothetical protein